jgi:serine/threonine protein kinase
MILEYAERGTLYERVKQYSKTNQKFSPTQILDWITEIIIGLYSLHKKDIMHRDIKSDNLFLCNNDVVKIGDLGQASNESKCKSFVGTFFYRAPECQDFGEYKKEIDIWSAGVVLYELIMLVRPFEGIEQKEVQTRIENIDYKPLPEDTDPKLKKLLEYTLTYQESRATAAQLLSLEFIKARIKYLCSNKILELEPSFMEEILNLNYKIGDIVAPKAVIKEYNFLKIFQNMQLIYYKYVRTVLYSDIFFNTILVFSHSCLYSKTLKEEEIRDLIDLGIIVPYEIDKDNNKNKKTKTKGKKDKYNAKYYNIVKNKIDGIDNTLNLPINDDDFFDNFYLDGLETSFKAFEKAKKTFNLFRRILEDEEINEEDKYNFSCSEEIYDFLLEIKNFQNINLNKYLGEEKIAIMLNIYQTMIYHYIIKCVMVDSDFEDKINLSLFQNLLASLKLGKFNISLKYKIAGEIFTIQDMKHIIFKIKSPSIFFFYQPSVKDDQRLKLLDEKYLNKLSFLNRLAILTICIDPPNFIDDDVSDIYAPVGICFKPNTLFKDLNSSLYHFISEKNVFPDENTVNFPKFIHEYIISLGKKENDVIQSLIEFFYKDFTQKMYRLINKSKQNILHINYC